jgi:uncharacterized membrane protein (UPF0127 family)
LRTAAVKRENGTIVCARCAIVADPWHRFLGLQGRAALAPDEGMLFRGTGSIHMFFMRFPIDAIFCDRELRVLHVARGLRPWRTAGKRGAKVVIEVAAGAADGVEPGDRLLLS